MGTLSFVCVKIQVWIFWPDSLSFTLTYTNLRECFLNSKHTIILIVKNVKI